VTLAPTYDRSEPFRDDQARLSREQRALARIALEKFIVDLRSGDGFRPGLRVKGVQGAPGVFEMTWAPDGRATFQYGDQITPGEPHIIWRRIGTHDIFGNP